MPTLRFQLSHDVLVAASGHEPLSARDWQDWVETAYRLATQQGVWRALVWSGEGAPSRQQSLAVGRLSREHGFRFSIVTEALAARLILKGVQWMSGVDISGFTSTQLDEACAFLDLAPLYREPVLGVLGELAESLDAPISAVG